MELRPEEITKIIRSQIKNYESKIEASETGVVIVAGDGIATVSGLTKCMANELVEFQRRIRHGSEPERGDRLRRYSGL